MTQCIFRNVWIAVAWKYNEHVSLIKLQAGLVFGREPTTFKEQLWYVFAERYFVLYLLHSFDDKTWPSRHHEIIRHEVCKPIKVKWAVGWEISQHFSWHSNDCKRQQQQKRQKQMREECTACNISIPQTNIHGAFRAHKLCKAAVYARCYNTYTNQSKQEKKGGTKIVEEATNNRNILKSGLLVYGFFFTHFCFMLMLYTELFYKKALHIFWK